MLSLLTAMYVGVAASAAMITGDDFKHPNATIENEISVHDTGFSCLALAAFAEARNQGPTGMALVVQTVINRIEHSKFPSDPCSVVNAPKQFEGIYTWKYPREPWIINQDAWVDALLITQKVIDGTAVIPQECEGSTHFLNPEQIIRWPKWTKQHPEYRLTCRFNDHQFYRQVEKS